jgi:DNA polymerase-4
MAETGALSGFCRDCFAPAAAAPRCTTCGSPRLLRHTELATLSIGHIDCDAFYAAVEKRDNPELRDKAVIVGGGKRGVVSTACYVARLNGVRSAMPMFKALKICPQAVVVKPRMARYVEVSREVRRLMQATTPLVEPLSLDEAFLDLTGTTRVHGTPPSLTLALLQRRIEDELGISVSVGLSYCKFAAKLASDLDKPRGFSVIGQAEAMERLGALPAAVIWGVGRSMQQKLASDGITMIAQIQKLDEATLMRRYGSMGQRLYRLSRSVDDRQVEPVREAKSVSAENTFDEDIHRLEDLSPQMWRLAQKVAERLKREELAGRTITLKLKGSDFRLHTRSVTLEEPTQLAERLYRAALPLLEAACNGTPYRLLGIGATGLAPAAEADPPALLDPERGRQARIEAAMDMVRGKFGSTAIDKGRGLNVSRTASETGRTPSSSPSGHNPRNPGPVRR